MEASLSVLWDELVVSASDVAPSESGRVERDSEANGGHSCSSTAPISDCVERDSAGVFEDALVLLGMQECFLLFWGVLVMPGVDDLGDTSASRVELDSSGSAFPSRGDDSDFSLASVMGRVENDSVEVFDCALIL